MNKPALGLGAVLLLALAVVPAHASMLDDLFGPKDYEDCVLAKSKDITNTAALYAVQNACNAKFPARRSPDGDGYVLDDPKYGQYPHKLKGPVPTAQEWEEIAAWKHEIDGIVERDRIASEPVYFADSDVLGSRVAVVQYNCDPLYGCTTAVVRFFNGSHRQYATGLQLQYFFVPSGQSCPVEGYYLTSENINAPPRGSSDFLLGIRGASSGRIGSCLNIVSVWGPRGH